MCWQELDKLYDCKLWGDRLPPDEMFPEYVKTITEGMDIKHDIVVSLYNTLYNTISFLKNNM